MAQLYFVAGASGSGKTAIIQNLKETLDDSISIYDFDDIGVPDKADKKWRQESTEKWLKKLIGAGKKACLLGQVVLGEILACPSAKLLDKIEFCLLDVNDFERIKRLKKRNTYGADQNMLNWASWLRMHTRNPQWMQHVIKEDCCNSLDFSMWDTLSFWDNKANTKVLDTSILSIEQVAQHVAAWILDSPQKNNVIFLNGPSSSGKTSLARYLQDKLNEPYLHIGIDTLINIMPEKLNNWKEEKKQQGFWWKKSTDAHGNKLAYIQLGAYAQRISSLLKEIVITMLKSGHNVIVDEVCMSDDIFNQWRQILSPYNTVYVALITDTTTLEAREKQRDNRTHGSARAQNLSIHSKKTYDFEINTTDASIDDCATIIINHIKHT